MRIKSLGVIMAVVTGAALSGCATRQAGPTTPNTGPIAGDRMVITAAVFGGPALSPIFTIQGVLADGAGPVNGSIPVYALIRETEAAGGEVIFETPETVLVADEGLFALELTLPDPEDLANAGDLIVELYNASDDTKVGAPLPMRFTPRAWTAEFARTAESAGSALAANSANTANFANSAAVADTLSNDRSIGLDYSAGYENYGFGYDDARATRVGNIVFLSGLVEMTGGGGGVIAILPADMRPIGRHIFSASSNGQYVRVDVLADGRVQLLTPPQVGWFSLTGLSFPVAP